MRRQTRSEQEFAIVITFSCECVQTNANSKCRAAHVLTSWHTDLLFTQYIFNTIRRLIQVFWRRSFNSIPS